MQGGGRGAGGWGGDGCVGGGAGDGGEGFGGGGSNGCGGDGEGRNGRGGGGGEGGRGSAGGLGGKHTNTCPPSHVCLELGSDQTQRRIWPSLLVSMTDSSHCVRLSLIEEHHVASVAFRYFSELSQPQLHATRRVRGGETMQHRGKCLWGGACGAVGRMKSKEQHDPS